MAANTVPVKMFWNAEIMPSTAKDEELVPKLNAALKRQDERYFLSEIVLCASEDAMDATRRRNIAKPECPVTFIKAPVSTLECDGCECDFQSSSAAADLRLLKSLMLHALSHPPGAVMLVVASDDLSCSINDLVSEGYTILSAVEDEASTVAKASSVYWLWEGMQQEGAPLKDSSNA